MQGFGVISGASRAETNLLSDSQGFNVFFDVFQDCFRYYLWGGKEHANTPPIAATETGAFFGIVTIIPNLVPGKVEFQQLISLNPRMSSL